MMDRVPDNYDLFEMHEAKIYNEQRRRPRCSVCEEPIMEDYLYRIKGLAICPDCLDEFKEWIEDDEW